MWYNILIKKFKKRLLEFFLIFLIAYSISLIPNLSYIIKEYMIIHPVIYIFSILVFLYYWLLYICKSKYFSLFCLFYGLFLIINLFMKVPSENNVSTKFYLKEWIKLLLVNRIVFINVIGNIILFIPLGYLLKSFLKDKIICVIIGFTIPLILELIQFFTKLGVFDLIDILLNLFGTIIGLILKRIELWMTIKNLDN